MCYFLRLKLTYFYEIEQAIPFLCIFIQIIKFDNAKIEKNIPNTKWEVCVSLLFKLSLIYTSDSNICRFPDQHLYFFAKSNRIWITDLTPENVPRRIRSDYIFFWERELSREQVIITLQHNLY